MEPLLPSEIARLVLGYLEEQDCGEAAQIFLEKSPLLQECNAVAKKGGKFSRKVNGLTLTDLIDKFCGINILVQERLSKLDDSEQLKNTGDLLEQLKSLMDGPRGQRFVVNINVPAQNSNQIPGGSPIISSSMRKRRHSGQVDREKLKKPHKANPSTNDRAPDPRESWESVETTSLDQLPGHQPSKIKASNHVDTTAQEDDPRVQCSSTVTELPLPPPAAATQSLQSSSSIKSVANPLEETASINDCLPAKQSDVPNQRCEIGTNTQEIMAFTNTEVQTIPCHEMQSELVDGPTRHLSLLGKELLNRTELHERIAETINRTRMSTEASFRESSFADNLPGECNTSIMMELDHAIKSIVNQTEMDPIFEKFLVETIGRRAGGETSPDEDGARSPNDNNSPSKLSSAGSNHEAHESPTDLHQQPLSLDNNTESQLVKENNPPSSSTTEPPLERDKECKSLDDMNAQAVLSIINVNNTTKDCTSEKESVPLTQHDAQNLETFSIVQSEVVIENILPSENQPENCQSNNVNTRKRKNTRPKREREAPTPKQPITEEELITVPTLIVCSQEEIQQMRAPPVIARTKSQFIPIRPKTPAMTSTEPPLFLRAVNVVRANKPMVDIEKTSTSNVADIQTHLKDDGNSQPPPQQNVIIVEQTSEQSLKVNESITLYGGEDVLNGEKATVVQQANIPPVEVEESISFSGTGLSPFLKFHRQPLAPTSNNEQIKINDSTNEVKSSAKQSCDMLTKRTPRSIMKSRSRNHRLSFSTPRRRSSHIRALDFSTPTKGLNSSRRLSDAADKSASFSPKASKACRTSLFKSPPFTGGCATPSSPLKKTNINKSPIKVPNDTDKPSIATNSPAAPKLIGGWDKITGVGMIIDGTSPEKLSLTATTSSQDKKPKSWDADLRMAVMADVQPIKSNTVKVNKKNKPIKNADNNSNKNNKKRNPNNNKKNEDSVEVNKIAKNVEKPGQVTDCPLLPSHDNQSNGRAEFQAIEKHSESMTTTIKNIDGQVVTKKYAKLKTITTTVTKSHSSADSKGSDFSHMPELETPRKFDPHFIPPTPRLLSPNNTMTTPFAQAHAGDDSVKLPSFVSTPEFPPTPSINLTPKPQSNDNTIEDSHKKDGYGSKYYQPSSEVDDKQKINDSQGQVITMLSSEVSSTTSKLEITQFEVIKENLPKEEAIKELKISKSEMDEIQSTSNKEINAVVDKSLKSCDSSGTVDDSSCSESDTSSSSSDSYSSCSTCCDDTNTSSKMSTGKKCKKTPHKVEISSSNNDLIDEAPAPVVEQSEKLCEKSPAKCIPIIKDDKDLKDLETPAKDDNLQPEADISETPSSSKVGVESTTNLSSKISAIMNKDSTSSSQLPIIDKTKSKPRIISIETLVPAAGFSIKEGECPVEDTDNRIVAPDSKLSRELDEKRLRMISKLKADLSPSRSRTSRSQEASKPTTIPNKKPTKAVCQPIRKSVRNAERRALKNLSESGEKCNVTEPTKSQSSRELSHTAEDSHLENVTTSVSTTAQVQLQEIQNQVKSQDNSTEDQQSKKIEKGVDKSKVEMIKRDLFSDEENDGIASASNNEPINDEGASKQQPGNGELLPGVLESLQLVPANKSSDDNSELELNSYEHIEISFVYDEKVAAKKRRRKISNSELEMKVQTWSESGDIVWQTMTTTNYEEIFNITPPRRRRAARVVADKPVKALVARRKGKAQLKNSKSVVSMIQSCPLATSSPVKDILTKDDEKKIKTIQKTKASDKVIKPRKRKNSESSKDGSKEEVNEKKTRAEDPTVLLSKINIDKFLNQVHGPPT